MRFGHRRVWMVMGAMALLGGLAGLLLHTRATAVMETEAARAALIRVLAGLPSAGEPAKTPPVGTPATSAEEADLLRVTDEYQRLLREGEYEAAWELTHPDTRGPWDLHEWALSNEPGSVEDYWEDVYNVGAAALMLGTNREVVDVVVSGDEGLAHIAMDVRSSAVFALKRHGDGWAIDLAATENAKAKQSISSHLEALNDPDRLRQALWAVLQEEIGPSTTSWDLDLGSLPVEGLEREIGSATIDADAASVETETVARLHLAIPLEKMGSRWGIDEYGTIEVIAPDADLSSAPPFMRLVGRGARMECTSNIKQLALAYLMYSQDYDECMPFADKWCEQLPPYVRNLEIFRCPADDEQWSYAMNYKASRQRLGMVAWPGETIMLFETEPSRRNAYDEHGMPGESIARPERHAGENVFAYIDGHASTEANRDLCLDHFRLTGKTEDFSERPWAWAQSEAGGVAGGELPEDIELEEGTVPEEGYEEPAAP